MIQCLDGPANADWVKLEHEPTVGDEFTIKGGSYKCIEWPNGELKLADVRVAAQQEEWVW